MSLKQLRELRAKLLADTEAIIALAETEKRDLTEEEATLIDEMKAQDEQAKADIADIIAADKKKAERKEDIAARKKELAASAGRKTTALAPEDVLDDVQDKATITTHERWLDDPKLGFKDDREYLNSVVAAGMGTRQVDEKLIKINAALGQNTLSGEDGGFVIPPEFSNRVFERVRSDRLGILAKTDHLTLTGNTMKVPGFVDHDKSSATYRHAGIVVYDVGEGNEITASNLKFRQIKLELNKKAALAYATEEMLSDTSLNMGQRIFDKMGEAIGDELTEDVMFGDGVGRAQGALTSDAVVSQAKESGQVAATIVSQNIIKMKARIWSGSEGRVNWYYNQGAFPQLASMYIAVGTGGVPVWLPANGIAGAAFDTLYGEPAWKTDHCAAVGTVGDIAAIDWSQYYTASKGTPQTAMSMHVRFIYDELAFRTTFRFDGTPAWDRALTPRKGADDVSPFVTLAKRV